MNFPKARGGKPYMTLSDVCRMLGKPPTKSNLRDLAKAIRRRIDEANGALARYDPRKGAVKSGPGTRWYFTTVSLRRIYPEFFDRRDDVEKELARRFRQIERMMRELEERIEREGAKSRQRDEVLASAVRRLRPSAA